jgi:hypothetical protein
MPDENQHAPFFASVVSVLKQALEVIAAQDEERINTSSLLHMGIFMGCKGRQNKGSMLYTSLLSFCVRWFHLSSL